MNNKTQTLITIFIIFIITEVFDIFLDNKLGNSFSHSIIQLVLFLVLFITTSKIFLYYHNKQIKNLIPEELIEILETIKKANQKRTFPNQIKIQKELNITKPTAKKRLQELSKLKYIRFEKKGNNKYIALTNQGKEILS